MTKKCAITDTLVNLTLSFVLVNFLGIAGVLIATVISVFIAEYIMKSVVIHQEIFKVSSKTYFIKNLKFWAVAAMDVVIGYKVISFLDIDHIWEWFAVFGLFTIVNGIVILIVYKVFGETSFLKRLTYVLKRKGVTNES